MPLLITLNYGFAQNFVKFIPGENYSVKPVFMIQYPHSKNADRSIHWHSYFTKFIVCQNVSINLLILTAIINTSYIYDL